MKLWRFALASLAATTMALAGPAVASAASQYDDTTNGYEYYATSTEGRFAGSASGDLPGYWNAIVDHTPLSPNATIIGGSVDLATTVHGKPADVKGTAAGGTVTRLNPGATGCVDQYYAVNMALGSVGVNSPGSGTGDFDGTLIHHRHSVFGYCATYSATINGTLTLKF
jgi:hypothetical protein